MPDQKPVRLAGDERTTLLGLLQFQRESFVRKIEGVENDAATSSPVASGTSILWLANHMADAEAVWVLRRFAQRADDPPPAPDVPGAIERYRAVTASVDEVVRGSELDDLCPPFDDQPQVNMRWILGHLLEETARHAGHADILRELIDGSTGR
jgi:hypothetical protein